MAIRPIDLPAAAGLDYSGGDVRHFSQGDGINVPGMSNPTRHLAKRDSLLAEKLNEVVSVVNNQEQFVPLPLIRTMVPPSDAVTVVNYRIPAGFEARVLNAVVSTNPATTTAELDVYYSASFGGATGTAVVTCTPGSEFAGDVNFYQTGEFIVILKNTGPATLEVVGSVLLTMRPLGAEGTLLVGSVIQGQQGPPGMRGATGPQGPPGTGGAGSPGMNWQGNWADGATYSVNDTVSYAFSGTYGSWICRAAHTAILGVNDPSVDAIRWNTVAFGVIGSTGTAGPQGATAQGYPLFTDTFITGRIVTASDYGGSIWNADYTRGAVTTAGTTYTLSMHETVVSGTSAYSPRGLAILQAAVQTCFRGSVSVILPSVATGGAVDYSSTYIKCMVAPNGTLTYYDGTVATVDVTPYTNGYGINVVNTDAIPMSISLFGVQGTY